MVQQILAGFGMSLDAFGASLAPGNPKLARARAFMASLTEKAERGADIAAVGTDPDFAALGALLGELAAEPPATAGPSPEVPAGAPSAPSYGIPPASLAAAGYHMAWSALPPDARAMQSIYYDRIFAIEEASPDAVHFNALLEEDGVLLEMARDPLTETARETLAQAEALHAPTILHQQRLALETYPECRSRAELEYRATLMAETANVEHEWDALYLEVIGLLPACAQAVESFGPHPELVAKLRASRRFMADFWGVTWEDVFQDPRYLLFWEEVFWPKVPEAKRQKYDVHTAEGWRDLLKGTFYDPFVKDEPPVTNDPAKARITFWRSEHPTREVLRLLEDPPRPAVPEE